MIYKMKLFSYKMKGWDCVNIKGKYVTLRAMGKKDMELVCNMFNDPELEDAVVGWSFPLSLEQQNRWFENNVNERGQACGI